MASIEALTPGSAAGMGFFVCLGFFKVIFLSFYFNAISSLQFTEASFDCVKMEVVQLSIFLGNSCCFSRLISHCHYLLFHYVFVITKVV